MAATATSFPITLGTVGRQTANIDIRTQRGTAAERLAAGYLQARGLQLVARNLRCKTGELDLVCRDGGVLAIIEVRQRGRTDFGGALGSVTWRKQRKIIRAAHYFLQRNAGWRGLLLRFDVLAVEGLPAGGRQIVWIKDAFRAAT